MEYKASHRHAKISARKARLVIDQIRGKSINQAWNILFNDNRRASAMIKKVLHSAQANADNDEKNSVDVDKLYVKSCFVNEGKTLKRWRPRARGMATPIHKRTSHIHVVLAEQQDGKE